MKSLTNRKGPPETPAAFDSKVMSRVNRREGKLSSSAGPEGRELRSSEVFIMTGDCADADRRGCLAGDVDAHPE